MKKGYDGESTLQLIHKITTKKNFSFFSFFLWCKAKIIEDKTTIVNSIVIIRIT